jgi:putative pyruvate formate lyase activating enzyme
MADEVSPNTYVNVIAQYHPCHRAYDFPLLGRSITKGEYLEAVTLALQHGLKLLDQLHYPRTARVSF